MQDSRIRPRGIRSAFLFLPVLAAMFLVAGLGSGQEKTVKKTPITQSNPASGKQMFADYCSPCHGLSGKGDGPAASSLKTAPVDLTLLAKNNGGKFPAEHVIIVLRQGSKAGAHGSSDMPVWGPLFKTLNQSNTILVDQRIHNLTTYLESTQAK